MHVTQKKHTFAQLFQSKRHKMKLYSDAELAKILDKNIFHSISDVADSMGVECYVVGGYVRDIFLERPSKDIDVVVVGSGIEVATELKKRLGRRAHLSVFRNFGTAQVKIAHGYDGDMTEVEFVGARRESYNRNSRKPIVEDGTLEDDMMAFLTKIKTKTMITTKAICNVLIEGKFNTVNKAVIIDNL